MKRIIYTAALVLAAIAAVFFLSLFCGEDGSIDYLTWETIERQNEDGSFSECEADFIPQIGETYRFTAHSDSTHQGELVFELNGMQSTLHLDGEPILLAKSELPDDVWITPRAAIPLYGQEAEITLTCTVLSSDSLILPPLARYTSVGIDEAFELSYANYYAIPTGVFAILTVLLVGLFLLSAEHKQIDFSLIPLALFTTISAFHWISIGMGYYFLPQNVVGILSWGGFEVISLLCLVAFLIMRRGKRFWKAFGLAVAVSVGIVLAGFLVSLAAGWSLSEYIIMIFDALFEYGNYFYILYWLNIWIAVLCAIVASYEIISNYANQESEKQMLVMKNEIITDGYHAIEKRYHEDSLLRHEFNHNIVALYSLWKNDSAEELGDMLEELYKQVNNAPQVAFTGNLTINAILQNAATRAAQVGARFNARVYVPDKINIPEKDICCLLMNMLENAVEAAGQRQPETARFIRFSAEVRNGFLAVKCENSFSHMLKIDDNGKYISTKQTQRKSGLGITLMQEVAERYGSILDISHSDDGVFIVQTALKLP